MNNKDFSKYTYQMINKLPHWFKMRKNPEVTTGGNFLNIMGIKYDELESILNYIYKQNNLITADTSELNYVYKGFIPSIIKKSDDTTITSDSVVLKEISDVKEFFKVSNESFKFPELAINDPYYIDYKSKVIYTKKAYNGNVNLEFNDRFIEVKLKEHKVWNVFDEFGYWFGLERNPNEENLSYKNRLLDIFKNESGSNGQGFANALARELNLRKNRIWEDGSKDFVIKEPMVIYNQIKVNGEIFPEERIVTNERDDVILKGDESLDGISREVSFITGLEIKEINNKEDITMVNRIQSVEGGPTSLKKKIAQEINSKAPILFDHVKADVHNWNIGDTSNTDKGVLEVLSDTPIQAFIKYGVVEQEIIINTDDNYGINTWEDIFNRGTWGDVKEELQTWKNVLISKK